MMNSYTKSTRKERYHFVQRWKRLMVMIEFQLAFEHHSSTKDYHFDHPTHEIQHNNRWESRLHIDMLHQNQEHYHH